MPLLAILMFLFGLLSLTILGGSGYLLWSWFEGEVVRSADGALHRVRDDWRLWTGLALLAWSFLGRWLLVPLLARRDERPSKPERWEGRTITGPGGSLLRIEATGSVDDPPIVLTHGWGLDSTIWSYARRDLARRFRVIAWDLPGLGKSEPGSGGVDLGAFAADLGAVVSQAGGRPVVLVGHSIGGMVIQTLARDQPEMFARLVAGVVLLNTTYTNPLRTMVLAGPARALQRPVLEPAMKLAMWLQPLFWLGAWQSHLSGSAHLAMRFGFGRYVTRSQLEHATLLATRNPPGVQARGNLAMFRWDAGAGLAGTNVPVLVMAGERDIVTLPSAGETIAGGIPGSRLQVVPGVNHMGFLECPAVYDEAIQSFAASVQPSLSPGIEQLVATKSNANRRPLT